jgi:hypothetical protein
VAADAVPRSRAPKLRCPDIPVFRSSWCVIAAAGGEQERLSRGQSADFLAQTVTPIATATNTARPPITVGDEPRAIAITPVTPARPRPPTRVTAAPGYATATVSWMPPASLGTGVLTGYTATASPGGAACATTCTITGLANGTTYRVTVVTHTPVGDSPRSAPAGLTAGNVTSGTLRSPMPPAVSESVSLCGAVGMLPRRGLAGAGLPR